MSDETERVVAEFRRAAREYVDSPSYGTRYTLEMAAAECKLHGINPSAITPHGIMSGEELAMHRDN